MRVTSGSVDIDAHLRRARHTTRDRMRRLYAEEEVELRREAEERAELAEELRHLVFVL